MAEPEIKIMACSNVYVRLMHFKNKGDVEAGHLHNYDHATVLSGGKLKYEVLDKFNGSTVEEKIFTAPDMVFVAKDKYHRLTALENNTTCSCVHALRTIDSDLIPTNFLIETTHSEGNAVVSNKVKSKLNKKIKPFVNADKNEKISD